MARKNDDWETRFWDKVNKSGPYSFILDSNCWDWQAFRHKDGHGQFKIEGVLYYAHRVSYILAHGDLDDEILVRHRCNRAQCVNPAHLETGTIYENMQDRKAAGGYIKKGRATNLRIPGLAAV